MSSEHVEVLERLRGVLEHGKMGDKCLIAPDLVTAAIAALSAPQPPAEAQAVGAVRRDTGVTITLDRLPYYKGVRLASGTKLYAHPPPSAPVGVEVRREIQNALRELDAVMTAEDNTSDAVGCAELALQRALEALAQQLAAPVLAKHQPCGCVICTCEDEQQCQGCGAKHCGNRADHPPYVAQQPAAVDETAREDATPPATSPVRILIDAIESEIRQLEGKADWKSQTARIANLRAAIDAAREARHG